MIVLGCVLRVLEIKLRCKFHGQRAQVASCHEAVAIVSGVFLRDEFGTCDATLCSCLVEEVDHCAAEVEHFVDLPVHTAEAFPTAVEIIGVVDVGISLAEIAEARPEFEVGRDHVARVKLYQHLRDFCNDISRGIDASRISIAEGHGRFVFLVSRLLVGEERVKLKSLEGADDGVGGPSPGLDVVAHRGGHDFSAVLEVER